MTRVEFTRRLTILMSAMYMDGEKFILDYVKRSDVGQMFMFKTGKSKCDGVKKKSKHQSGKASDIYFIKDGKIDWDKEKYIKWHKFWEKLGGRKMIAWDIGHYE